MPSITINGRVCEFSPGQTILQIANSHGIEIPQYCYHDGLSIVASCRICLVEIHAPNPRTGQVEPFMGGKLMPSCQQTASDGMVVYADSPKAVANQKAVMEYLLINHPLDCPVCDQSGECFLQDYSYLYGRGVSRFEEQKVKQPKKDLGTNVLLYADRCIMCTRCVRFTREVTGTSELCVTGRGNKEEIDVFPGVGLDNPLSANVVDLCPVGALLDKDFLFAQRVWFLKETPSIDGLTASGDNLWVHHNEGSVHRVKPRHNPRVNKWWIADEIRYGWKFVHSPDRLRTPGRRQYGVPVACDWPRAYDDAVGGLRAAAANGGRVALLVSPFLSCEDAFLLGTLARTIDPGAILGVGPVPTIGTDTTFPNGASPDAPNAYTIRAEKAPNARGVRRVLEALGGKVETYEGFLGALGKGTGASDVRAVVIAANAPRAWADGDLETCLGGKFVVAIDILPSRLTDRADIVLPGATWLEKCGTFENAAGLLQAFEQCIPVRDGARSEGQIALDMLAILGGADVATSRRAKVVVETTRGQVAAGATVTTPLGEPFDAGATRARMAASHASLARFTTDVSMPPAEPKASPDMAVVEL